MDEWMRRRREALLAHPLRAELMALLGDGALGLRELHRRLAGEPPIAVVVYHLAQLQAVELVSWEDGRYRVGP
ncbi:MAG: hypothetical protein JSS68_14090 [Actinobacteria bacterium]|nr:hypothetical protein [Actinomycetota bacterium]